MNLEVERKRKRTYSGSTTLTSQHVTDNLQCYGEIILHCTVNITRGIRECGNTIVLKYVCALLNSGGGILHMRNLDAERGVVLSKHLDTWWSGMEIKMAEILSRDDICNYFDLVGNHDDHNLYLFVKTAEHLCTLTYHCRLPTDTATHDVTYQSLMRLLVDHGEPGSLQELPPIPDRYIFGRSAEELKKETKQIQFKQLSTPQKFKGTATLPGKVCGLMIKYVSAFANHEGGHIYFGIGDTRASVIGEEMNLTEQRNLEQLIGNRMRNVIWRDMNVVTTRGVHWDVRFFPVENPPKHSSRVVVVVSVVKFPGGVFTASPVSSFVNTEGRVEEFTFNQWREAVLNPLQDVPELHHRFHKVSLMVPRAPLVFTLPNTIETIINKVLLGKADDIQPRMYIESYADHRYREAIKNVLSYFKGNNSVCFGMECWGLKIPMMQCDEIICDVAVVTEIDNVHVLTLATCVSPETVHHSQSATAILKNRLVLHGGCTDKFSAIAHVIDITQPNVLETLEQQLANRDIYPTHFQSSKKKFKNILHSVALTMGAYMARSQALTSLNQNGRYHFLLTHDQFELLWTQQYTKELWVHGPGGAGKTVAAVQMIQELRRRGCNHDNILYLAENEKLAEFVRSHNLCLVTTRREVLADAQDQNVMDEKYSAVCNVIVDEAQNFKDRDGDWYSLAERLANQKPRNLLHRCCNYFWLFMDYSQKVHKFKAGLPSVIGKNNFMLSEVSRSTKEIFDFTSRLMMASEHVEDLMSPVVQTVQSVPKLAHNFSSGKGVDILSCKESEIAAMLNKVLAGLMQNGIHGDDIAILVGKRKELDHLQPTLSSIHLNEPNEPESQKTWEIPTRRSVEEHLQKCGSDRNVGQGRQSLSREKESKPEAQQLDTQINSETSGSNYMDDLEDVSSSSDEAIEMSNQFDMLAKQNSDAVLDNDLDNDDVAMETSEPVAEQRGRVKFYQAESVIEEETDDELKAENETWQNSEGGNNNVVKRRDSVAKEEGISIDTVRRFSGLDKAAVIGVNPYVNEEHADFKKFMLSLATRAKDNLVIITTSDNVKQQLDKLVH